MTDKELEQQDKQEQKEERQEERKKTLKTVITSVICTLLFAVILLLITILCLKNCSPRGNNNDSSSSNNEPTWSERDESFNTVFLNIVKQNLQESGHPDVPTSVIEVTVNDHKSIDNKFDITISTLSEDKLICYDATGVSYPVNYQQDYLTYLSSLTDYYLDSTWYVNRYPFDNSGATPSEANNLYRIGVNENDSKKYFSGSYYKEGSYYIFYKKEVTTSNPFDAIADLVISSGHPLYGYYQYLYSLR